MAFRVPTQVPRRRPSYSNTQCSPGLEIPSAPVEQLDDDTTQWVLFSPAARTHTTSTERTRTAGASRLSDFGSFGTATRSATGADADERGDALEEQFDEDGTELDSLDDGLQAFRAPSLSPTSPTGLEQGPPAMLPAHDGLGSFQASSQPVQDQLWQHEQYNPQRQSHSHLRHRRHSSVQIHLDTVAEGEADTERQRWQRIEQWRMDQSRALLHEIERETRRQQSSLVSVGRSIGDASPISVPESSSRMESSEAETEADESFWRRITRKVIRNLIGIDDALLSVIFGESLPLNGDEGQRKLRSEKPLDMETVLAHAPEPEREDIPLWQTRVLQRIAHELGVLVHQLCEHPGAFTTYFQMTRDISSEYAGMSLSRLAESMTSQETAETTAPTADTTAGDDSMPSPRFMPTLHDPGREHAAQWGIEEDDPTGADPRFESARLQQEQEYWERGLDAVMVFRYLRTRFSRRGYMASESYATSSARRPPLQDPSRRAAIIRQHHPLVARAHSRPQTQSRRPSQYSGVSGAAGISLRRPSSSCASQSAKLSAISSRRTLTGSSRNYWDIGGSVDSGSAIGVGAGLGTWGEA